MNQYLQCGAYRLSLAKPLVMGIVNLTPDSFSGDGLGRNTEAAIAHARQQWELGADILDIGAESSRPGIAPTPLSEELDRLLPVLEVVREWGVPISVDTYKPEVMREAIRMGAALINDISGLEAAGAAEAVADSDAAVCIMHMRGQPQTMQQAPVYENVVDEVWGYLAERVECCRRAGIPDERLILDPGFGFGKTLEHNLALFRSLGTEAAGSFPVLVGVSRKTMLGQMTGRPVGERMMASVTAAVLAAARGAKILRVHDVAQTKDALAVWAAIEGGMSDD